MDKTLTRVDVILTLDDVAAGVACFGAPLQDGHGIVEVSPSVRADGSQSEWPVAEMLARQARRVRESRLREAANAEAARQVARCAAELGYVGEPATLAVAVGDACLAFARELREIHARHAVTVKRLEAELARAVAFAEAREKISRLPVVLVGGDPVLLAPGAELAGWTAEDGGPLPSGARSRPGVTWHTENLSANQSNFSTKFAIARDAHRM